MVPLLQSPTGVNGPCSDEPRGLFFFNKRRGKRIGEEEGELTQRTGALVNPLTTLDPFEEKGWGEIFEINKYIEEPGCFAKLKPGWRLLQETGQSPTNEGKGFGTGWRRGAAFPQQTHDFWAHPQSRP